MLIRITDEATQEAIERVRMRDGDRSWADTVRRLVREADPENEAAKVSRGQALPKRKGARS